MLTHISIRDFAIIDNISLDFKRGLHILTGETGAGKSIIIEAVSMALGGRADTTLVRSGKDKAIIELAAEIEDPGIRALLAGNSINSEDGFYILREIYAGGKSICRVNGTLVSLSFLNNICRRIADIHGQYDHQSLLDPDTHLKLLDEYGKQSIGAIKQSVYKLYEEYKGLENELNTVMSLQAEQLRNRDFMQYELSEITQADPIPGEDDSLSEQLLILQNSEKLYSTLSEVYELLYGQSSSLDTLGKSSRLMGEIKNFSNEFSYLSETISDCFYRLEDLCMDIRKAKDSVSFSPEIINTVSERIDLLNRLKKKYGGTLENVLSHKQKTAELLSHIDNSDQLQQTLAKELSISKNRLDAACEKLTALRKDAAKKMELDMARELGELNFKDSSLTVSFTPLTEHGEKKYTESGSDQVEFLIVTNKGEQPKPLSKIASGGEISRIMLAFKAMLGGFDGIPTLIFDEIDSGVSGITASIVGKKLKQIAGSHQVICITHLAQIAAFSDYHYQIQKDLSGGRTVTTVKLLNQEEKTDEIARLLSGLHVTEAALKNAKELISESLQEPIQVTLS